MNSQFFTPHLFSFSACGYVSGFSIKEEEEKKGQRNRHELRKIDFNKQIFGYLLMVS
jgi:hypothetical protein